MSVKDKVLLAIYDEYQKDIPNMDANVTWSKLQLNKDEFNIALDKLDKEGLINGLRAARGAGNKILIAYLNEVTPSVHGIRYVKQNLYQSEGYIQLCEEIIRKEKELLETVKYCREHNMAGIPLDDVEMHVKETIEIYNKIVSK